MFNDRFRTMRLLSPPDEGGSGSTGADEAAAAASAVAASVEAASAPAAAVDAAAAGVSQPDAAAKAPSADAPASTSLIGDADAKAKDAAPPAPEAKAPDAAAEPKTPDSEDKDAKADTKPEADKPKDEPKKDDVKDAAKDDAAAAAAAEPPPVVALTLADLKLPDNIKLAEKESKAFFDVLNDPKLEPKARAQGLIDLYIGEIGRIAQEADQRQRTAWDNYNVQRKSEVKSDPEVGGNRMNTALSMAKAVIEEYGGTEAQRAELFNRLDEKKGTGMGNDVYLIRLLNNIGRKLNVFEDGIIPANPSPPKQVRTPGKRGWYDQPSA